jgi:hypothetical protein
MRQVICRNSATKSASSPNSSMNGLRLIIHNNDEHIFRHSLIIPLKWLLSCAHIMEKSVCVFFLLMKTTNCYLISSVRPIFQI